MPKLTARQKYKKNGTTQAITGKKQQRNIEINKIKSLTE